MRPHPEGGMQQSLGPAPEGEGWRGPNEQEMLTCPLPKIPREWYDPSVLGVSIASLYGQYTHGSYPWPGGLADQPAWYPPAMQTVDATLAEARAVIFENEQEARRAAGMAV